MTAELADDLNLGHVKENEKERTKGHFFRILL